MYAAGTPGTLVPHVASSVGIQEVAGWFRLPVHQLGELRLLQRGERYVTTRKGGTRIEEISDIKDVTDEKYPEKNEKSDPFVRVVAVDSLSTFQSCIKCRCKLMKLEDEDEIGKCTKCNTLQFLAEAKYLFVANFTVKTAAEEMIRVRAYGSILLDICETTDESMVTSIALLKPNPFTMHAKDGTILSIKRQVVTPFNQS